MSDHIHQSREPLHPVTLWLFRLVALVATILAMYLGWHGWHSSTIAGCDAGSTFGCDEVLSSRWSKWFGIPVAILAIPVYSSIFAITWFLGRNSPSPVRQLGWLLIIPLIVVAGLTAVWFTGLQLLAVKHICPYCMGTHACGLFLLGTLVWHIPKLRRKTQPPILVMFPKAVGPPSSSDIVSGLSLQSISGVASLGAVAFLILVGGQLLYEQKTFVFKEYISTTDVVKSAGGTNDVLTLPDKMIETPTRDTLDAAPKDKTIAAKTPAKIHDDLRVEPIAVLKPVLSEGRQVIYLSDKPPLTVENEILIGDVDAEYIAVELMDYTCPSCRKMYSRLLQAHEVYGKKLAVAIRPVAIEKSCNAWIIKDHEVHENACRYAILAMAVWKTDKLAFPEFHHWLMVNTTIPSLQTALQFAEELVDGKTLRKHLKSVELKDRLADNHNLWHELGDKLPTIIISEHILQGMTSTNEELQNLLSSVME